jgi:hypothetical protein
MTESIQTKRAGWMATAALTSMVAAVTATQVYASDELRRLPDEYESFGGHSLGMANGGSVATGGLSAVRLNPAMLALEKTYAVSGGWHWPTSGREFYQAGVVDSTTGSIAAGASLTSAMDDYRPQRQGDEPETYLDSPIKRRVAFAFAQAFKLVSIGVGGQYVQGRSHADLLSEKGSEIRGTTFSTGVVSLLSPQIRLGLSAENLGNSKIREYAPRTTRAGLAWIGAKGDVTLHLDYVRRERVEAYEGRVTTTSLAFGVVTPEAESERPYDSRPEEMAIASTSARVQDYLRLMAGVGQSFGVENRRVLGGGVAIVSNKLALSWTAMRPWMPDDRLHQSINLSIEVSM